MTEISPDPDGGSLDSAAVSRVAAGDLEALGDLYERYGRMVYSIAYRVLGDAGTAEECVQDVFTELWRHAGRYDSRRGRISTWLCTIARNRSIDLARSRKRRELPVDALEPEGRAEDPADLAAAADAALRVALAIADLPRDQLEVVQLAHFNGLTQSEISERLELPLGTVKSRMRAALRQLRPIADEIRNEDTR